MLMLRTSGDILPLPHISRAQISRNSRNHLKIVNVRVVTQSKSHTEGPQLLKATVRNSVTVATPLRVICSPLLYRRQDVRPHHVQKHLIYTTIQCEPLSNLCRKKALYDLWQETMGIIFKNFLST